MSEQVLLARAYLSRVAEPGCVPLWGAVRDQGPVAVADAVRSGDVPDDIKSATRARAATTDPQADLEAAERCGATLLGPEWAEWPHFAMAALERTGAARLREWRADPSARKQNPSGELVPPLALWVRGDLSGSALQALSVRSVALVGARNATQYGDHVAKELAFRLAMRDVDIVSGGAFGIDTAAHRGALAADGRTIIVSARGLDLAYPSANRQLFDRVAESGAVVSESPPGAVAQRHRFLSRNRLIAAFGTGTVVVEAARRSGALNTAGHSRGLGRPLMAVPGPVTSAMSSGAHLLIARETDPARLVCDADDVLALVGGIGEPRTSPLPDDERTSDRLDAISRHVFDGFPGRGRISQESLARTSGVAEGALLESLAVLRALGLVEVDPAGGYRLAASGPAGHAAPVGEGSPGQRT